MSKTNGILINCLEVAWVKIYHSSHVLARPRLAWVSTFAILCNNQWWEQDSKCQDQDSVAQDQDQYSEAQIKTQDQDSKPTDQDMSK